MADTAAHLVDRVFPHVPVRQWVLSFPHALRYRLAYDSHLITDVLDIFIKTVFASLIRRAAEFGAVRKPQCGAVSFIQRFGSALDLNVHIHAILLNGIYAADDEGRPHFQALLSPDNEEVARVTASLAKAITDFLRRRGLGPERDREESDPLSRDQPWLAGLYAASVLGRIAVLKTGMERVISSALISSPSLDGLGGTMVKRGLVMSTGHSLDQFHGQDKGLITQSVRCGWNDQEIAAGRRFFEFIGAEAGVCVYNHMLKFPCPSSGLVQGDDLEGE